MMKKALAVLVAVGFYVAGWAQSLESIRKMMDGGDLAGAKAAIDQYLQNPKKEKDADGWYFKGHIYNSYSRDEKLDLAQRMALKDAAFEAFQNNQTLDGRDVRMKLEGHQSYLDLYFGFYDLGAKFYNAKNYAASYDAFKKANAVKDFILGKKYVYTQVNLYPLDTAIVMNMGLTANLDKREDVGMGHYRQLADANVNQKDYESVYEALVQYYNKIEDKESFQNVLAKGRKFFPKNAYLMDMELRSLGDGDKAGLFEKYENMLKADPQNYGLHYNYAIEMYNSLYVGDDKPADPAKVKTRLTEVLKTAISLDKEIDATVLMSNHLFNFAADVQGELNAVKGKTADDVAKRKKLQEEINRTMDEFVVYAEKAVAYYDAKSDLKPSQKAIRVNILTNLSDVYSVKGDLKKAAEYDKAKLKGL